MQTSFHTPDGPVSVKVGKSPDGPLAWLDLQTGKGSQINTMTIFTDGPLALEKLLDLGYEIVNAARKLMPQAEPIEAEHVPFAINDAIEHDEAMATMPDCYDPDNDDRPNLVVHP